MSIEGRTEIEIGLTTRDAEERNSLYERFSARKGIAANQAPDGSLPDIVVVDLKKKTRLGAFDSHFIVSMVVSIAVSGTGVALWLRTEHQRSGGAKIPSDSDDGKKIIDAVAPPKTDLAPGKPGADEKQPPPAD